MTVRKKTATLFVVLVSQMLVVQGCGTANDNDVVQIAVTESGDPAPALKALASQDIPCLSSGSAAIGIGVFRKDVGRALRLLRSDSAAKGYWIELYDPPQELDQARYTTEAKRDMFWRKSAQ